MTGRRIAPRPADASTTGSHGSGEVDAYASPSSSASVQPGTWADAQSRAQTQVQAYAQADADTVGSTSTIAASPSQITVRKKVTSACQGCQRRRVKCDGGQPCSTCLRTKSDCSYTRELDGRSIKRKYHEVQRDQDLLNSLLETIRHSKDEHVAQIVQLIRSDASMDHVKACMVQQLSEIRLTGRERSPEFKLLQANLAQLHTEADDRPRIVQRSDVLGIQRLADRPLHKLPSSPWTTVTEDDDLVSNLISVWLTWDKGWHDWIDKELFIRDMKSGSLDSKFCSPFLVNCLLAWGCPYSDFREARSSNGAVSQLMQDFIAEAKRLLETESDGSALDVTMVQGLLFLHAAFGAQGIDRHAYRYMLQAVGMMSDIVASAATAKPHPEPQVAKEIAYAIDRTSWGVYIVTTQGLISMLKPQFMRAPRRARPGSGLGDSQPRMWIPYPNSDVPIPSYRDELFEWACDLATIEAQLSRILFDVEEQPSPAEGEEQIMKLYRNLQQGAKQLPPELDATLGSCPTVLMNQIRIQTVYTRMFSSLPENFPGATTEVITFARQRCVQAAMEVARICKIYMDSWGPSFMGIMCCTALSTSSSILLEQTDNSLYSRQITDLLVALRAMSRRWPLCMGMLRTIQLEARSHRWRLPSDTDKLFEEFESSAWRQREQKKYITLFPTSAANKAATSTGHDVQMGKFLEMMELLELGNETADPKNLT